MGPFFTYGGFARFFNHLFWQEVHRLVVSITTLPLALSPAQFLLHHSSLPRAQYFKSLAMHMINAARLCIPVLWGSTRNALPLYMNGSPEWVKTADMENWLRLLLDTPTKFSHVWACWTHFLTTPEYRSLIDQSV
ncbi:unnamed protein product [Staurois parvus]|uniref:Uncharacterized protein n=1 Tax=Staurois parvus TaxID=386267 RepID=A0ABN9HDH8_9NEOB|nr:unnamed protein product [Staurois parvus]